MGNDTIDGPNGPEKDEKPAGAEEQPIDPALGDQRDSTEQQAGGATVIPLLPMMPIATQAQVMVPRSRYMGATTVAELRSQEAVLPAEIETAIAALQEVVPMMDFEAFTPSEVTAVAGFVDELAGASREELLADLVDFCHGVVRSSRPYPDAARNAAREIIRWEEGGRGEPYLPWKNTEQGLCAAVLRAHPHLLARNLPVAGGDGHLVRLAKGDADPEQARFESLPRTIHLLRKTQDLYVARQPGTLNQLLPDLGNITDFHAELIMNLQRAGKKLADFLPSGDKTPIKILWRARVLKERAGYMRSHARITPAQMPDTLKWLSEYGSMMTALLEASPELMEIAGTEVVRTPGDAEGARMELALKLDDSSTLKGSRQRRRAQDIAQYINYAFKVCNRILVGLGLSLDKQTATGQRPQLDGEGFLQRPGMVNGILAKYLGMGPAEREAAKQRVEASLVNPDARKASRYGPGPVMAPTRGRKPQENADANRDYVDTFRKFFEILDQYVVEEGEA